LRCFFQFRHYDSNKRLTTVYCMRVPYVGVTCSLICLFVHASGIYVGAGYSNILSPFRISKHHKSMCLVAVYMHMPTGPLGQIRCHAFDWVVTACNVSWTH
jgi:hypothetical protein